ncbi:hypothetical protein AV274_0903 [Blastocystis sp. ATCC 50177/Nand II]|uniref:Uncharacterized protein n=1 Tax=Blastocystis sp. subtype 1 (strain ATCC 50177 / NandII) TaxID=478820 RepID=A0A196SM82_BLAHN|nr:hypothetical protein AV274_0903 [Blastocystis sp. ATCC 50177/Nand II]
MKGSDVFQWGGRKANETISMDLNDNEPVDTAMPVVNRYSSITTIDDIGVNCEYIHLQKCPDCYGNLYFSELSDLVSVVIDDDSLNNALFIVFALMSKLESITIGAGSFITAPALSIENCDKLESLKIGPYSFNSATSFKVMNCQNLKSITIGNDTEFSDNFLNCDKLVLSNLPALETILFGMYSFNKTKKAEFTNLWNLKTITVGSNACHGTVGSSLTMTSTHCCYCVTSRSSLC